MTTEVASEVLDASINLGPMIGVKKFPVQFNIYAALQKKKNSAAETEPSVLPIVQVSDRTISKQLNILSRSGNKSQPTNVVLKFNKRK